MPRAFSCKDMCSVSDVAKQGDVELIPHLGSLINLIEANSLLALLN